MSYLASPQIPTLPADYATSAHHGLMWCSDVVDSFGARREKMVSFSSYTKKQEISG